MTGRVLFVAAGEDAGGPEGLGGGLDVTVAEGALDAMKRLAGGWGPPDCVVVDASVADLPLDALIARVRSVVHGAAVVVVGEIPSTPEAAAVLVEADAYVPPDREEALADRVRRVLAHRRVDLTVERHRRLAGVVADVAADVARAPDRRAVEAAVYDRLTAGGVYRQVWVGRVDEEDGMEVTVPVSRRLDEADLRDLAGDPAFISRAVRHGEVTSTEGRVPTRGAAAATAEPVGDGGAAAGLATAVVPFVDDGRVLGVGLVSTSVEDALDAAERELLADLGVVVGHALAALERGADQGTTDGMGTLVHELKNPLSIAMSHLEIAREDDDPEALERVDAALERVVETIDRVAAGVGGGASIERSTLDLGTVAEEAWGPLSAPEATLVVAGTRPLSGDRDMVVRLLANLFQNAIVHGGPSVTVRVGTLPDGFYVEDDGPGVPAGEREAVLERGYTTADDGLGLGLSIVQSVAEAHGWTLSVRTSEEGGARFELTDVERPADGGDST